MKRTFRHRTALALTLGLGSLAPGCDEIVDDSSFQLWCDGVPCAWDLEEGALSRAPTWHEQDYGISLDADPTAISQFVPANRLSYGCMRIELISSADRGAEMRIELDFDDDGTLELERTLGRSDYSPDVFFVGRPEITTGLRVRLRKYGPGSAVIAQIRVQGAAPDEGCLGPTP